MTPRTTLLGWLVLLTATFLIAALNACGSAAKPSTAKPAPKQTMDIPMVCLRVEREGKSEAVFCGSQGMCSIAHAKLVAYWDVLEARYGVTGLSDCTPIAARFSSR